MIEEALVYRLKNHSGVAALVGTRVYPLTIPQDCTFPAACYQMISGQSGQVHGGRSGVLSRRYQVTSFSDSYASVKRLAQQVMLALDGISGYFSPEVVLRCQLILELDAFDEESRVYRVIQDFMVEFRG